MPIPASVKDRSIDGERLSDILSGVFGPAMNRDSTRPRAQEWGVRHTGLAAAALLLIFATDAYAYTDPGSGALLWQMGVAALFGAAFYARRVANWVSTITRRRGPDEPGA
jgi:hypothetical protein